MIITCRRFEVINPTISGYEFNWTYIGRPLSITQPSSFKCLTSKGYVEPGRTFEVCDFGYEVITQSYICGSLFDFLTDGV